MFSYPRNATERHRNRSQDGLLGKAVFSMYGCKSQASTEVAVDEWLMGLETKSVEMRASFALCCDAAPHGLEVLVPGETALGM